MSASPETLLVISASARALVRSARRSGWRVSALDGFGDQDTRACVQSFTPVRMGHGGLDRADLARRLRRALKKWEGLSGLVYGGGAEAVAGVLAGWGVSLPVYGNAPEVVRVSQDPAAFFALLDRLAIPHPEVRFSPPRHPHGWLSKSSGGIGGTHVARLGEGHGGELSCYFQREIPGPTLSVSFLADGRDARILGFNTLWTAPAHPRPFTYGGAVNRAALSAAQRARLSGHVRALVAGLGLVGLNGVDVVMAGGEALVLELNPRPSATFELYDVRPGQGLLDWHIRACQGTLPPAGLCRAPTLRGHEIVYADRPLRIGSAVRWPAWCSDRPCPGTGVGRHEPLCTVHAHGARIPVVMSELRSRRAQALAGVYSEPQAA